MESVTEKLPERMRVYQIRDWPKHFENNKSREREELSWVAVPNKHHGLSFQAIMAESDGPAIYGIWVCIIQHLSRHRRPRKGWLTRDGSQHGKPLTSAELAFGLHRTAAEVQRCLDVVSGPDVDWMVAHEVPAECPPSALVVPNLRPLTAGFAIDACPPLAELPPGECPLPVRQVSIGMDRIGLEGNGEKRNEGDGIERESTSTSSPSPVASENLSLEVPENEVTEPKPGYRRSKTRELAKTVLAHLNAKAGRSFRDTTENLDLIAARLEDVALDTDGVRTMIDRMVALWKGDPKMEAFLRPETLFRKSKFSGYYDDRNQPVRTNANAHDIDHSKGF
jgi:uncharacterized phage protein (TIGR02220 family)